MKTRNHQKDKLTNNKHTTYTLEFLQSLYTIIVKITTYTYYAPRSSRTYCHLKTMCPKNKTTTHKTKSERKPIDDENKQKQTETNQKMSNKTENPCILNPSVISANQNSGSELSSITTNSKESDKNTATERDQRIKNLKQNLQLVTAYNLTPGKLEDFVKDIISEFLIPHVKFTNEKALQPKGSIARLMYRKIPTCQGYFMEGNLWLKAWNELQSMIRTAIRYYKSTKSQQLRTSLLSKKTQSFM